MSVGNLKDQGNKGNNFPYQLNTLKTLGLIARSTAAGATEATLLQVLASIQAGQEYEQNLVTDLGGVGCPANCPTYLQIRIWDTVNHVFLPPVYYDAAGAVVVPVGPIALVNPQYVLENILTQVTAINADLDVALSTRASEATLSSLNNKFTPVVRTPGMIRSSGVGAVAAGTRSVSVYNAGLIDAAWLGAALKPGEQLSFEAGAQGDTLGAFAYDGTGTDLLITTTL